MFSNRSPRSGQFTLSLTLAALRPFAVVSRFTEVGRAGLLVRAAELRGTAAAQASK